MKLHLPKQLFTAILAAITLAAAPAALTLGSAAWGAWTTTNTYTLDEGDNAIKLSEGTGDSSGSVAGIVFVKPNDASDEAGSITSITFDNDTAKQLVITGDWNGAFNFTGLTVGTLNVNVGGATLNIGGNQASNASQVVTINGMAGSNSLSSVTVKAGSSLTLDGNNTTTYTGVTTVEAGATLTIKHTKALGSWNGMTADDVLGRVEGAGTLVIDFTDSNPDNIDVAAKGSGDSSSLGGFTGVVDIQRGKLYIGNNPSHASNGNNAGDFGASKVIVRNGAEFWTHSNSAKLTTPQIDLMSGATLGNKDGHKEYTGNIRFNVVDPYATGDAVQYDENGVACISAHWGKELKYSGLLEGDGTVKFLNTIFTGSDNDWSVNYYLLNEGNKFSGTYELADNEECKEDNNDNDEIRLYLEKSGVAQYASINLSSTKATSKLILGADSTIVNLNGSVAKNLVTTKDGVNATLTVSGGSFAGMLQNGANNGILSLTKTGAGTLTLSGTNTYTGTTSVQGGELILTSASALGSGNISVAEGAALTLNTNSTIELSTAARISGAGTVHIMDGTTLVMSLASNNSGTASVKGSTIHVHGGGILNLDGNDCLGWESNATGAILLKGESDTKLATLELGGRQTQTTDITMSGNAQIVNTSGRSASLNAFKRNGALITVSGKGNTIEAGLITRDAFLIEVGRNGKLLVSGAVSDNSPGNSKKGNDAEITTYGVGSVVKKGAGELEFSNADNTFAQKYVNLAGTTLISGGSTFSNGLDVSGGSFEVSGTATIDGTVTNTGTFEVSGGTATISGAVTNNSTITVSGGEADFTGTVTNTGTFEVSGGTATITGTLTMDTGSSTGSRLSVSGGSATVSGALNVTGTGVQISQSDGELNLTGSVSVAEGAAATLSGDITLGHTITNNGSLTLNGRIYLTGDIETGFNRVSGQNTESSYVMLDAEGTASTNDNGFLQTEGVSYYLTQSSDGVTNAVNNFVTNTAGDKVVYHGDTAFVVNSDNKGLYFSTGDMIGTQFYINTGSVTVDSLVQKRATGYTLQGGTMIITDGSVSASAITCDGSKYTTTSGTTGIITVGAGAKLLLDTMPGGASLLNLLKGAGMVNAESAGRLVVTTEQNLDGSPVTTYKGKLEIVGAKLSIGLDQADTNNLSSLSEIILNNGGNIFYKGKDDGVTFKDDGVTLAMDFQKITVESGTGIFHLEDSGGTGSNTIRFGEFAVAAGASMQLASKWQDSAYYVDKLTGAGEFHAKSATLGGSDRELTVNNLAGFSGDLVFTNAGAGFADVTVNTGSSNVNFHSLSAEGVSSFTFNANANTTITGTLSASTGTVNIAANTTLTLGDGSTTTTHTIGTLSAASGTVSVSSNGTLSLGTATHSIGTLTGGGLVTTVGNLSITNAPAGFTGALEVQGSTATVTNATSDFRLKNLTLDGSGSESGASFEIVARGTNGTTGYSYNIEQLTVSGTGTLANTNPSGAPGYQSQWNIGNLTNAEEGTSGVLNLNSWTKTDNRSIINLNGGDFAGEINLQGNSTDNNRKVALNVNAETAAADAVVSLSSSGQKVALGIGADRVVLKGINGSAGSIISGAQAYHKESTAYNGDDFNAIDTTFRTLVIDTNGTDDTAAVNSSTSATLGSYLNLEKQGAGTQTFSGDMSGFNGTIEVTGGTLKFTSGFTASSATISQGAELKLSDTATVTNGTMSQVKLNSTGISSADTTGTTKGSISNANVEIAQLAEDASFTIEDMTLTNTTITAATTTQVKLQNVTASNVVLAQGKFSTDADMGVTVGMGGSGSSLVFEGGLASDTITINASTGASLAVDLGDLSCVTAMGPGKYDLSITLSGVKLNSYTDLADGAGITFEGWLGELIGASSGVKVSFSEAVAEEPPAAAAEGGAATGVTYSTGSVGTVITITGLNVPEPATSTLSLLALAALAARRRRK